MGGDGTQLRLIESRSVPASADGAGSRSNDVSPPLPPLSRLLTAREVAAILRVPRSTVYELTRQRRIPFLKVGRRVLFDQTTLAAWIASEMVVPRAQSR